MCLVKVYSSEQKYYVHMAATTIRTFKNHQVFLISSELKKGDIGQRSWASGGVAVVDEEKQLATTGRELLGNPKTFWRPVSN